MTRLEVMMESLVRQIGRELEVASGIHSSIDESVTKLTTIVERQDGRLDTIERNIAWAIGAVAVLIIVFNVLAPSIQQALGLPK